jgi:hypothetical protein
MEKWKKTDEFELDYDKSHDGIFIGIEDIRLFVSIENKLFFNGNRGTNRIHGDYGLMTVEHGAIDLIQRKTIDTKLMVKMDPDDYPNLKILNKEKNWVLFTDVNGSIRMVYNWYPLQIGTPTENNLGLSIKVNNDDVELDEYSGDELGNLNIDKKEMNPQDFQYVRGSSNGVTIGHEIWFLCHYVRYEMGFDYGHVFVVLDANTLKLKRVSKLFTFEGERIEFTLGFVYSKEYESFIIGYSVFDRDTNYMVLHKRDIETGLF